MAMMPAGKYYVGDLCYVMSNDEWKEICGLLFEGRNDYGVNQGEFTMKDGRRIASYHTAYGDGVYESNIHTSHSVDSGGIGCILVSDIEADKYEDIQELGAIVDFAVNFPTSNEDGEIQFGHVSINTKE
jgi:hypothetical protein